MTLRYIVTFIILVSWFFKLANAADDRPNFVLFITDDISQDDLACYGNPDVRTPHLDQWAADGLRFNNAYLTCSSCSPSRCSLITGRYPHNTGAPELHTRLPEGQFMFPQALKEAGHYTARNAARRRSRVPGPCGKGRDEARSRRLE